MVWCLLVVPNCCLLDPLAKVSKTAEAAQIPLVLPIIRNVVIWTLAIWILPWFCLTDFGHSKKKCLMSTWFFSTPFTLRWIKNEALPLSIFNPNVCLRAFWACCGCSEILFLESKYSVSKSLLLCFLMTQAATSFVHLFSCIMFLCPLLLPPIKHHHCAVG